MLLHFCCKFKEFKNGCGHKGHRKIVRVGGNQRQLYKKACTTVHNKKDCVKPKLTLMQVKEYFQHNIVIISEEGLALFSNALFCSKLQNTFCRELKHLQRFGKEIVTVNAIFHSIVMCRTFPQYQSF